MTISKRLFAIGAAVFGGAIAAARKTELVKEFENDAKRFMAGNDREPNAERPVPTVAPDDIEGPLNGPADFLNRFNDDTKDADLSDDNAIDVQTASPAMEPPADPENFTFDGDTGAGDDVPVELDVDPALMSSEPVTEAAPNDQVAVSTTPVAEFEAPAPAPVKKASAAKASKVAAPATAKPDAAADKAPTKPAHTVTGAKQGILAALASGWASGTKLTGHNANSIAACNNHGWIKSNETDVPRVIDATWKITAKGRNALAWAEKSA